jgi:hypothetical protein
MQHMCIVTFNAMFNGANVDSLKLQYNIASTSQACCLSCRDVRHCNAWQWCPQPSGCVANGSLGAVSLPYLGCQLLNLPSFSSLDAGYQGKERGVNIPFVAGAPLDARFPNVDGYTLSPGSDLAGMFDFACNTSTGPRCIVNGSVQTAAMMCSTDPYCDAFTFRPNGVTGSFNGPISILKHNNGSGTINESDFQVDPSAAVYVKSLSSSTLPSSSNQEQPTTLPSPSPEDSLAPPPPPPSYQQQLQAGEIAGIVIASVTGGLAIILTIVLTLTHRKRFKKPAPTGSASGALSLGGNKEERTLGKLADEQSGSSENGTAMSRSSGKSENGGDLKGGIPDFGNVVVEEIPAGGGPPLSGSSHSSIPPGSSARELLNVFSQMYASQPLIDHAQLATMLEEADTIGDEPRMFIHRVHQPDEKAYNDGGDTEPLQPVWSIRPEDVEVCRRPDGSWWQLGVGAFGTVYKGLFRGYINVAIKVLHRLDEPRHSDSFAKEVQLMVELQHANIVQFMGACLNGPQGTAMLITELMELGDLWRALPARDGSGERLFGWYKRGRNVMTDVARGLKYLHSKRVVHFDLKSANILLSRNGTAKLADVGMARAMNKSYLSMVSSGLGTFAWSAPEVLNGKRCSVKADIYSWGVVLWEVCSGEAPVRGGMRVLRAPEDCPADVAELYQRCVSEDPEDRPSAEELLDILEALPPL